MCVRVCPGPDGKGVSSLLMPLDPAPTPAPSPSSLTLPGLDCGFGLSGLCCLLRGVSRSRLKLLFQF